MKILLDFEMKINQVFKIISFHGSFDIFIQQYNMIIFVILQYCGYIYEIINNILFEINIKIKKKK